MAWKNVITSDDLAAGVEAWLATPSSANLATAVTGETGSGALVFADTPTLVTPLLGIPTSGTLTNCTGLPIGTGVSGLGTNVATFLATPSSANLAQALTDETGTDKVVFNTSPALVTSASITRTAAIVNSADSVLLDLSVTANSDGSTGGFFKAIKLSGTITQNATPGVISDKFCNNDLLFDFTAGTVLVNFSSFVHRMTHRANGVALASGTNLSFVDEETFSVTGGGTIAGVGHTSYWSSPVVNTGATLAARYGLRVTDLSGTGAATLQVAVEVEDCDFATTNLSLRSAGAAVQMRHAGPVRIGDTATAATDLLEVVGNITMTAGGTLSGSLASGGALTLQSTTHATKSLINFLDETRLRTGLTTVGAATVDAMAFNNAISLTDNSASINVLHVSGTWTSTTGLLNSHRLFNADLTLTNSSGTLIPGMIGLSINPTMLATVAATGHLGQGIVIAPVFSVSGSGTWAHASAMSYVGMTLNHTQNAGAFIARTGVNYVVTGGAGTIVNEVAFDVGAMTGTTLAAAFRSAVAAGTGKWCILSTGTADSSFAGGALFGKASTAPDGTNGNILELQKLVTTGADITDGQSSGLTLTPAYTGTGATRTMTRHNYIKAKQPTLTSAAVTNGCLFWFDAAIGTHVAVGSGTTKTSPGTVTAWIKININGTVHYMPAYSSTTS